MSTVQGPNKANINSSHVLGLSKARTLLLMAAAGPSFAQHLETQVSCLALSLVWVVRSCQFKGLAPPPTNQNLLRVPARV